MKQFLGRRSLMTLAGAPRLGVAVYSPRARLRLPLLPSPPSSFQRLARLRRGLGDVTAQYDAATLTLQWHITYSGLSGPAMAAHFHGPATPGIDAPPVVPIPPPLTSPIDGAAKLTLDEVSQLLGGLYYVNLHTQAFPNGEIRGQVNVQP